ncbi:uncharacterized protein ARMOST_19956 [Armillaria ostoyae]|uniref:Ricin B lectin domain-containing protein n=1 Tax=Armillaria ostoyae TaxID=47428 RepID=A0A284S5Z9_ARMOS|nr:uncharacterized protein ARMOST_19956 [Armillaria ostoyae]
MGTKILSAGHYKTIVSSLSYFITFNFYLQASDPLISYSPTPSPMPSSMNLLFFSALFLTAATASPLSARGTCSPNFEGASLTVSSYSGAANGVLSWSANPVAGAPVVASTSPSKFFFQQNGDTDVTYTIKTAADDNFAVELNDYVLVMNGVDWSGSNVNQKWIVECTTCATNISQQKGVVASGCAIFPDNTDHIGYSVREGGPGGQLTLAVYNQQFDFSV